MTNSLIDDLRRKVVGEEFDYQLLMDCLQDYDRPRDKIRSLLRQGVIVRIKKGLYVFGPAQARHPYSKEVLANLMYGPSYVSLAYALHYHGLLPERVETLTCVTTGRGRRFVTPVGVFTYRKIPVLAYALGIQRIEFGSGRAFLLAGPEKALADHLHADRGTLIRSQGAMRDFLVTHLRIDLSPLAGWNPEHLMEIARAYRSQKIRILAALVRRLALERTPS